MPRLRRSRFFSLCSFALLAACGQEATTAKPPSTPPAVPAPVAHPTPKQETRSVAAAPLDVDPVSVGLTERGIVELCDSSLATASAEIAEVRALDQKPDGDLRWENTLGKIDRAKLALRNGGDFPALMAVAHPDNAFRERAKTCEPKVERLETGIWLDAALARVVKRYAAKKETLPPARAHFLEHVLREFRRNGLELDDKKQTRLRRINEELTKLGQDFDSNLAASNLSIQVSPSELDGLPAEWLKTHPPDQQGKVRISTDYPDYFPVVQYAKNRKIALELHKQFDNRAADTNVAVLEKVLFLRDEKAKLLGYATWADYVLEPRMAKSAKTVASFLDGLRAHVDKKGKKELAEFRAMHQKLGGKLDDPIPPSDRLYLEDQVRKARYGLDSKEVSQYFEVGHVKDGLLAITSKLFDIRYRKSDAKTWHADVEPMEVTDASGRVLGRFYFDLYPREGKYKHAAVFGIRDAVIPSPGGTRLMPIAAIECNFPKPGQGAPALMSHQDVVTFFHEFGHVLHHLLSESELSTFAGTSVARDFVEAPSQMLEEWAWTKDTLDLFAVHHETGKKLPKELHAAMLRSRSFGRAIWAQRQLFLAALDQAYHTQAPGFDTTKVLKQVHDAYMPFQFIEGTHFQASFGHLMGYDAGYYGYQWALSIAQDLFTRFKKEGMLNPKTAAEYRARVLSPGGSEDESKLVERFLGRPPSDAAYKAFLVE